ncbi:unnamed protein product, partial [Sphagnum compactum]
MLHFLLGLIPDGCNMTTDPSCNKSTAMPFIFGTCTEEPLPWVFEEVEVAGPNDFKQGTQLGFPSVVEMMGMTVVDPSASSSKILPSTSGHLLETETFSQFQAKCSRVVDNNPWLVYNVQELTAMRH